MTFFLSPDVPGFACVAPVLSPDEAAAHPLNTARGHWLTAEGTLQAAPAPRFDGKCATPGPIPARGQHDTEIRAELAARR